MRLGEAASGTANRLNGAFNRAEFEGSFVNVFCDGGLRKPMVSQMRSEPALLSLRPGETVPLGFDPSDAVILPLGELARE